MKYLHSQTHTPKYIKWKANIAFQNWKDQDAQEGGGELGFSKN
jgi:hypothetical protein